MMWNDGNWSPGGWVFMIVAMAPIWTLWAILMVLLVVVAVGSPSAPRTASPPDVRPRDVDEL
ncbi:hypothetical protein [Mycolicibacterium fortuitum]